MNSWLLKWCSILQAVCVIVTATSDTVFHYAKINHLKVGLYFISLSSCSYITTRHPCIIIIINLSTNQISPHSCRAYLWILTKIGIFFTFGSKKVLQMSATYIKIHVSKLQQFFWTYVLYRKQTMKIQNFCMLISHVNSWEDFRLILYVASLHWVHLFQVTWMWHDLKYMYCHSSCKLMHDFVSISKPCKICWHSSLCSFQS